LIDIAVKENVIEKSGSWFSYGTDKLGQGRERVKEFLDENSDLAETIEKEVKVKLGLAGEKTADVEKVK